jgi:hypothetical protein
MTTMDAMHRYEAPRQSIWTALARFMAGGGRSRRALLDFRDLPDHLKLDIGIIDSAKCRKSA